MRSLRSFSSCSISPRFFFAASRAFPVAACACFSACSVSDSSETALSRRTVRCATSSRSALFRCATLLYCEPRPCFAKSCPLCASQICFFRSSSAFLWLSFSRAGFCLAISEMICSLSAERRFASVRSSSWDLLASLDRICSSASSSLARVSSSICRALARSASSCSAVSLCFSVLARRASASASSSLARCSVASRWALWTCSATSRFSTSKFSIRSWAVRQSRSVSSYSRHRRCFSSCWYSTSSRCSSSRLLMRPATASMISSVFLRRTAVS
mmetsp:Transcript_93836/g.223126  ORF Transcript_93836/g.223126 Transcript_93836/m.223126 type:complete len:273 (+) Transcript_93836:2299-3117(+)